MTHNIRSLHTQQNNKLGINEPVVGSAVRRIETSYPLSGKQLDSVMNDHFKYVFDVLSDGLFYMNRDDQVFFYNPTFYHQFGLDSGHIDIEQWLAKIHPFDRTQLQQKIVEHMNAEDSLVTSEFRVRNRDGQFIWIEGTAITKTVNGERFLIGCHRDISESKLMETYVHQAAFLDSASGLANAQKLAMDIDALCLGKKLEHSLIYIHLEDIRTYLSVYGPQTLRDLMAHLLSSLSELPDEFVDIYRVRSDDFAILVSGNYSVAEIEQLGQRILETYQCSIEANGSLWGNNISVGIYPNFNCALSSEDIIKIASRTCQFARERHHNQLAIYHDKTLRNVDRYFYIERELAQAIKNNKLTVRFQPIIDATKCEIASFEALVRWKDRELGQLFPDEFIPVAEKKGLIIDLGYLVFNQACLFIKQYQQRHNRQIRVNINVSVLQLLNSKFPEQAKQLAEQYQIAPQQIVLELTETVILDGNKSAVSQLNQLNKFGFRLSLDDFGSGYSSLNSFFDLPLKQIKVDKAMAWKALKNPATLEYLKFITRLCHSKQVDIVIEGIEDANMQRQFTDIGVNYLQGYWFSKPLCVASASYITQM
ncbi:EAL domain-containing protein [Vibrio ponticus]|uniref:EAL domain-containing protein n=2 Tax=Vibrio ponticus TaxID=265668 RepID=A0A3N3E1L6_9VIBR|nr:EAL domain-containing protein [Vibrio ponticus]ROV60627.1 EAL domain-containing protein [Vibrio ponticus]